jgi:hypothetical protein
VDTGGTPGVGVLGYSTYIDYPKLNVVIFWSLPALDPFRKLLLLAIKQPIFVFLKTSGLYSKRPSDKAKGIAVIPSP